MSSDYFIRQKEHLNRIPKDEYLELLNLYYSIPTDGQHSAQFSAFHKKLYDLQIIFSFDWPNWNAGQNAIVTGDFNYSNLSLLEVSKFLTLIFRADRFNDGMIDEAFKNGNLAKLMHALNCRIEDLK